MSCTAMDTVLHNPELMTMIIELLPMYDLLFSQLICKDVASLVRTSPTLQRALFFRAESSSNCKDDLWVPLKEVQSSPDYPPSLRIGESIRYRINPLLYRAFPPWFEKTAVINGPHIGWPRYGESLGFFEATSTTDNLIHRSDDPYWRTRLKVGGRGWMGRSVFKNDEPWQRSCKGEAFLRADASWRKMLVVQPPVQRLHVLHISRGTAGAHIQKGVVDLRAANENKVVSREDLMSDGLRMGLLYDMIVEEQTTSVGVDWHMFSNQSGLDATILPKDRCRGSVQMPLYGTSVKSTDHKLGSKSELLKVGVLEDAPRYGREVSLMDDYTAQCTRRKGWTGPSKRSDGYVEVEIKTRMIAQRSFRRRWRPVDESGHAEYDLWPSDDDSDDEGD